MQKNQDNLPQEVPRDIACFYYFNDKFYLGKALSHKSEQQEYKDKHAKQYKFENNDDFSVMGHQILEFYFLDYMQSLGYPAPDSKYQKTADLISIRQQILNEKKLSEIAKYYRLDKSVRTGKQANLRINQKVLSDCFKAVIAAHHIDKGRDMDYMRDFLKQVFEKILEGENLDPQKNKASYKSQFYEFISKYPLMVPKISCQWKHIEIEHQAFQKIEFTMSLKLQQYEKQIKGYNKRELEENLFKDFMDKLNPRQESETKTPSEDDTQDECSLIKKEESTFKIEQSLIQSLNSSRCTVDDFLDDLHNILRNNIYDAEQ